MDNKKNEEDLRPVICWNCGTKFLLDPSSAKGRCPTCKQINEIVLSYADLKDDIRDLFTIVVCKVCGRKILIRKESEYVICANCKSTLLVEKDALNEIPIEYNNLSANEYYLLLAKENSFNPYLFPVNSEYYLEPNFEKKYAEERQKNKIKKKERMTHLNDGYDHLMETIRSNEMTITNKFINTIHNNNTTK